MALAKIIKSVLMSLYTNSGVSLVIAFLYMFLYKQCNKSKLTVLVKEWINEFLGSRDFRINFFLALYVALIMTRTLLCREIWSNPVSNVIGIWSLHDSDGNLYTENIENMILFLSFTVLLHLKQRKKPTRNQVMPIQIAVGKSTMVSFLLSLGIEFAQLFFKLGTWQLSDIFFNTLGGTCGGLIFWMIDRIFLRR